MIVFAKCIMKHLPNIVIMKKCDTVFNHNRPYVSLDERRRMSDSYLITIYNPQNEKFEFRKTKR